VSQRARGEARIVMAELVPLEDFINLDMRRGQRKDGSLFVIYSDTHFTWELLKKGV
jgi:hypothetical protein